MSDNPHIRIAPLGSPVTVKYHGAILASSERALSLEEGERPPVVYIPREDVYFEHLEPTKKTTHCPYKGDASYFSLMAAGELIENGAWSYEHPKNEVSEIAGHVAFDTQQVLVEKG